MISLDIVCFFWNFDILMEIRKCLLLKSWFVIVVVSFVLLMFDGLIKRNIFIGVFGFWIFVLVVCRVLLIVWIV